MHVDTHLIVKKLIQTNDFSCTIRSQRKVDNKTIVKKNLNVNLIFRTNTW